MRDCGEYHVTLLKNLQPLRVGRQILEAYFFFLLPSFPGINQPQKAHIPRRFAAENKVV